MKTAATLVFGLVGFMASCNAGDSNNDTVCTRNDMRCSSEGNAEICAGATWTEFEQCDFGCLFIDDTAECAQTPCTNGHTRCSTIGYIETCNNSEWGVSYACAEGCQLVEGTAECIVNCTPDETACTDDDSDLITCDVDGHGWFTTECTEGCQSAAGGAACVFGCPGDDPYEENIEGAEPPLLPGNGVYAAISCGQDQDWFAISLQADETLSVTLTWNSDLSDLDLMLFADTGDIYALVESTSSDIPERLTYAAGAAGTYYLQTFNWSATNQSYSLSVTITP
ncbi:MAG: hypothetical protein A2289_04330 [Deltaproteobacteria bacterium RIFOXYA12_FULL_58_15]|nr:MAG: hypothetical protein A2289_04330 [Deltaproteobacteria bacterium RIFOXYA12_FULL_58_15]